MTEPWSEFSEEREIPLEYRALYAESAPENGRVAVSKLNGILQRAALPSEVAAIILDGAARGQPSVDEADFYTALALVSAVQSLGDPQHALDTVRSGPPDVYGPLILSDDDAVISNSPINAFDVNEPPQFRVSLVSKRQGSFLFRHVVYAIDGTYGSRQCHAIRRYSDFVVLLDALVRKFPFRVLPPLPPKKLTVDGHYFTKDESFLEFRRSGLARFINLLLRHPVVGQDDLVKAFLVVDAPISIAMNAPLENSKDEFANRIISPLFIANWDAAVQAERWRELQQGTLDCLAECTHLLQSLYRVMRLRQASAEEYSMCKERFTALAYTLPNAFPENDCKTNGQISGPNGEVASISAGLDSAAVFMDKYSMLSLEVAQSFVDGPLEQLKLLRDMLISVRELFARYHRYGTNSIAAQERRIASTQAKLAARATAPDTTPEDLQKLRDRIVACQDSIKYQTNRDWLIKETVTKELEMARGMQFQIVRVLTSLSTLITGRSEAAVDLIQKFNDSISDVPKM